MKSYSQIVRVVNRCSERSGEQIRVIVHRIVLYLRTFFGCILVCFFLIGCKRKTLLLINTPSLNETAFFPFDCWSLHARNIKSHKLCKFCEIAWRFESFCSSNAWSLLFFHSRTFSFAFSGGVHFCFPLARSLSFEPSIMFRVLESGLVIIILISQEGRKASNHDYDDAFVGWTSKMCSRTTLF